MRQPQPARRQPLAQQQQRGDDHPGGGAPAPHLAVEDQRRAGRWVPAALQQHSAPGTQPCQWGASSRCAVDMQASQPPCSAITHAASEAQTLAVRATTLSKRRHPAPQLHLYQQLKVSVLGRLLICDRHAQVVHIVPVLCSKQQQQQHLRQQSRSPQLRRSNGCCRGRFTFPYEGTAAGHALHSPPPPSHRRAKVDLGPCSALCCSGRTFIPVPACWRHLPSLGPPAPAPPAAALLPRPRPHHPPTSSWYTSSDVCTSTSVTASHCSTTWNWSSSCATRIWCP